MSRRVREDITPAEPGTTPDAETAPPAAKRAKVDPQPTAPAVPAAPQDPATVPAVPETEDNGVESSGEVSDSALDSELAKLSPEEDRAQFNAWLAEQRANTKSVGDIFTEAGFGILTAAMSEESLQELLDLVCGAERPMRVWLELDKRLALERSPDGGFAFRYRKRLPTVQSFDDVVKLISGAKNVIVLTGAGISVAAGVPDWRSQGGVYDQVQAKYSLPDPHCLFDINYLLRDQKPFFDFAAQLYPSLHLRPTLSHQFIKLLESRGALLRNYTQNIDTLEQRANIGRVVHCHGSFATATCVKCGHKTSGDEIRGEIERKSIPLCPICPKPAADASTTEKPEQPAEEADFPPFLKPDIVFFGEALPSEFRKRVRGDCTACDLLIVMGSSLRVQPVALIPEIIGDLSPQTPQILINKESVGWPHQFDFEMREDCDGAAGRILAALGWSADAPRAGRPARETNSVVSSGEESDDEGAGVMYSEAMDEEEDLEEAMTGPNGADDETDGHADGESSDTNGSADK